MLSLASLRLRAWLLSVAALAVAAAAGACATAVEPLSGGAGGEGGSGEGGGPTGTAASSSAASAGGAGPCVSAEDCAAASDACNVGTCINGECAKTPSNELAACDDGKTCTQNDSCQRGECTGTLEPCASSDPCRVASCDVATDACVEVPGNEGSTCVDADPCTLTAFCQAGACVPGAPVDCGFLDGVCSIGVCDPQLGCVAVAQSDGTACDDGLYCTVLDTCAMGACSGSPNTCAAPGDVCMIGSCNEAMKSCVAVPGNDGAACDDASPCTAGETCASGVCGGGAPANPGAACDDGDGCTVGDTCANGTCAGGPAIVACASGDACCPAGCTLADDGDCALTRWSDGTMAWPDQACNPNNSFGGCDTNAQDHADAWATAVCQMNGYSSGVWTGNKIPGCSGEVSMWCGGAIPCAPIYELSCAELDQTQIELTCFP